MKTDIEIAQAAKLEPIREVAKALELFFRMELKYEPAVRTPQDAAAGEVHTKRTELYL